MGDVHLTIGSSYWLYLFTFLKEKKTLDLTLESVVYSVDSLLQATEASHLCPADCCHSGPVL